MPAKPTPTRLKAGLAIAALLVVLQAGILTAAGQPPISASGHVSLWEGRVHSAENSQQVTDWYTFSHVIHGILFYALLWLLFPRMPVGMRFALAAGIEVSWEVLENSPWIIQRYREQALAQGYFGDSVLNSISDSCAMMLGFLLASRLPKWASVAIVVSLEAFTMHEIHDGLILNIIQLIHPMDAIARWQSSV
jgi:hypothetical protein